MFSHPFSPHKKDMRLSAYITLLVLVLSCWCREQSAFAQDRQFSQFYAAPVLINPAFTGALGYMCDDPRSRVRGMVNHRSQWGYFQTSAFSVDYYHPRAKQGFDQRQGFGMGFQVLSDQMPRNGLRHLTAALTAAYQMQLDQNLNVAIGAHAGFGQYQLNYGNLTFPDQFNANGFTGAMTPDNLANFSAKMYPDLGAGMLIYSRNLWLGVAMHHLNQPARFAFNGSEAGTLPMHVSFHTGYRILLNDNPRSQIRAVEDHSISPVMQFRSQGTFSQMDLGCYYTREPLTMGLWYRGLPVRSGADGAPNQDAISAVIGLKFFGFRVGYSYDYPMSRAGYAWGGSHELSLGYQFVSERCKRKLAQKLACPVF